MIENSLLERLVCADKSLPAGDALLLSHQDYMEYVEMCVKNARVVIPQESCPECRKTFAITREIGPDDLRFNGRRIMVQR